MAESRTLRSRVPGQITMRDAIHAQRTLTSRSGLAAFFGVSPLGAESRDVFSGAVAELIVGDALDHLEPTWDVLHAIPLNRPVPSIDHLAIGPAGVFVISARNHSGQDVWVNGSTVSVAGHRQHYMDMSLRQAQLASELLSAAVGAPVAVTALVVVVNPQRLVLLEVPAGVEVVASRNLIDWLQGRPRELDGSQVAAISDLADRVTTWKEVLIDEQNTQELHREFGQLRASVAAAARRRMMWAGAAFVTFCGGVWLAVAGVVSVLVHR